ncbi:hypothetical protein HN51_005395, partial [Arachis hypogaea]
AGHTLRGSRRRQARLAPLASSEGRRRRRWCSLCPWPRRPCRPLCRRFPCYCHCPLLLPIYSWHHRSSHPRCLSSPDLLTLTSLDVAAHSPTSLFLTQRRLLQVYFFF